jgi:hypothetical protein
MIYYANKPVIRGSSPVASYNICIMDLISNVFFLNLTQEPRYLIYVNKRILTKTKLEKKL